MNMRTHIQRLLTILAAISLCCVGANAQGASVHYFTTGTPPALPPSGQVALFGGQNGLLQCLTPGGTNCLPANVTPILTSLFVFNPQTPGGLLSVGNNTILISPVPIGVNGTDAGHELYVSGGTGTAESCLITGGSAVAGQLLSTLIINCAHTHSGAWTIQSATGGGQEAYQANISTGGNLTYPPGTTNFYGTLAIAASNFWISGSAPKSSIYEQFPNVDVIQLGNGVTQIFWLKASNLNILGPPIASSSGYGVNVQYAGNVILEDVSVTGTSAGTPLLSGTVNTVGTAVTLVSGSQFSTLVSGNQISINGSPFVVQAVTDATHVVLTSTAGTQNGVQWSGVRNLWRGVHFLSCFFCEYEGGSQTSIYGTVDKGMVWEGTVTKGSGNLSLIGQPSIVTTGSDGLFIGNYVGGAYISQLDEYGMQSAWGINVDVTVPGSSCCMHLWNGDISVSEADGGLNAGAINVFGTTLNMWGTNVYGTANGSNPRAAIAINATGELMSSGLTFVGGAGPVVDNSGLLEMSGGSLNGAGNVGPAVIAEASSIGSLISGVKFYQWQASTPIITTNPAASNISICGNSFAPSTENFTVWAPVSGTYPTSLTVCPNQGVDDISATVASGININPGTSPHIFVSGTTAISNISGGWYGRKEDFTFTDPSPAGFSNIGSNVVTTVSAAQNQTLSCYFQPPITVAIIGATNASPIVITTASPHGLLSATPVTISGVLGNTAANGSNFAKTATFTATTFGLYSNIGLSTPVAGNGAFTAGGTLTYGGNVWYCK